MMNPELGMMLARARAQDILHEPKPSRPQRVMRRRGAAPAAVTPDVVPSVRVLVPAPVPVRRVEPVSDIARELVRMAIGNGYRREEVVRLIEMLW